MTSGTPFQTLEATWQYIDKEIDLNGYGITVNMAAGDYMAGVAINGWSATQNRVAFLGNINAPESYVIDVTDGVCVSVFNGASITFSGVTFRSTGSSILTPPYVFGGIGVVAAFGGALFLDGVVFDNCEVAHMISASGGTINTLEIRIVLLVLLNGIS